MSRGQVRAASIATPSPAAAACLAKIVSREKSSMKEAITTNHSRVGSGSIAMGYIHVLVVINLD